MVALAQRCKIGAAVGRCAKRQIVLGRSGGINAVEQFNLIRGRDLQTLTHQRDGGLGHDDDRVSVFFRQIKRPNGVVVQLLHRRRAEDDGLVITAASIAQLVDVSIGGKVVTAGTHNIGHNDGGLDGIAVAESFLHVVKTGAGSGSHDLATSQRSASQGENRAKLIFTLHKFSTHLGQTLGHTLRDLVGRGDRITGEKVTAGTDRAFYQCIVAQHEVDACIHALFPCLKLVCPNS